MTPAAIVSHTAGIYGLAPDALRGRDRHRRVSEARGVAAFLAYELTGASYRDLGGELRRAPSTVSELIEGVAARLRGRDQRLGRMVARVEAELA